MKEEILLLKSSSNSEFLMCKMGVILAPLQACTKNVLYNVFKALTTILGTK